MHKYAHTHTSIIILCHFQVNLVCSTTWCTSCTW